MANKTYSEKLKHPKWQMKRLEILKRDNATCQLCGDTETELHVHHLKYTGNPWEAAAEDLTTNCKDCHGFISLYKIKVDKVIKIKDYGLTYLIASTQGALITIVSFKDDIRDPDNCNAIVMAKGDEIHAALNSI